MAPEKGEERCRGGKDGVGRGEGGGWRGFQPNFDFRFGG